MNELQQVLLIFAVVVIAGLYFLSRSRQVPKKNDSETHSASHQAQSIRNEQVEHTIDHTIDTENAYITAKHETNDVSVNPQKKKASEALNDLGTAHIPLSESTEQRLTQTERHIPHAENSIDSGVNDHVQNPEINTSNSPDINPNQGQLFFGEEFDVSKDSAAKTDNTESVTADESTELAVEAENNNTSNQEDSATSSDERKPKHHVLVVDDPGMTGEVDEANYAPEEIKPSFGIPEEATDKKSKVYASTDKEPEVFVILVMSTGNPFAMTAVNQALHGVGLTLSEQSIFVKKDNMGNAFIKVANMLEPGTFPTDNLADCNTPGVAMILELPTSVRAPAAMHDLIMMARKVSQRLNGRLYNMEKHLIKESDLQSMRDAALDYESEPL